jgi:hypothetical protein
MRLRLALVSIFAICFISQLTWGASGCKCLCSIFYTAGGETKFCPESNLKKPNCDNWYFDIPTVTSKKQCFALGENTNDCKGYFKEQKTKDQWTLGEGGRFHSCKIF